MRQSLGYLLIILSGTAMPCGYARAQGAPSARPSAVEKAAPVTATPSRSAADSDRRTIHKLFLEGKFDDAIPLTESFLQAQIRSLGNSHWQTIDAQAMDRIAHRAAMSDPDLQKQFTQAWQAIDRLWPGSAPPEDSHDEPFEQSIHIFRRVMGDDDLLVYSTQFKWAYSLYARGHFTRSLAICESIVAATDKAEHQAHPLAATSRQLLARLCQLQHEELRAERYFRESAERFEQFLGREHLQTLVTRAEHAQLLAILGQHRDARGILVSLENTSLFSNNQIDPITIQALTAMGYAYCELGQWQAGEIILLEACRRAGDLRAGRTKTATTASAHLTLGLCWHGQGRLVEAEEALRKSVGWLESLHGQHHPLTQIGSAHLAIVLYDLQRFEEAHQILGRLILPERTTMTTSVVPSNAWWIWLDCQRQLKQPTSRDDFARQLQEAIKRTEVASGKSSRRLLALQLLLARYFRDVRREPEAADLYRECLNQRHDQSQSISDERLQLEQDAGEFFFLEGKAEEAERLLSRAAVTADQLRQARGNQGISSLWQVDHDRHWPLLGVLYARQGRMGEAWQAMEESRARGLRDRLLLPSSEEVASGAEFPAIRDASSPFGLERVQQSLPGDTAIVTWIGLWWQDRNEGEFWIGVLRAQGPPRWARLAGKASNGSLSADQLRESDVTLASLTTAPKDVSEAWNHEATNRLWQERFGPLTSLLNEENGLPPVRQLVVLYPSATHLPVEVLTHDYIVSYASSATIFTILRERALASNGVASRETTPARILAVGDPTSSSVDRSSIDALARATDDVEQAELPGTRAELESIRQQFGDTHAVILGGSEASMMRLDEMAERDELRTYRYLHFATHSKAHERAPLESALLLSPANTSASPVPVAERLNVRSAERDGGHLTARHVLTQWRLNADLVTLSACESGLGPMVRGEHFVGFSQAFLLAGSRSVVVSMWPVRDDATSLLMNRFYKNMLRSQTPRGAVMTKAESLAEAKKWLRELTMADLERLSTTLSPELRGRKRLRDPQASPTPVQPFSHPYFWASFVLIGDPGN